MPHHKRNHADNEDIQHDEYNDKEYKQFCHCVKCVQTHKEWCRKRKREGVPVCQRKCVTTCVYQCHQDKKVSYDWGFEKKFKGEWEETKSIHRPEHCPDGNCK